MKALKILVEDVPGGVVCIDLSGSIDARNYEKLEQTFKKKFAEDRYSFIVDLSRLEAISSAGAGVFLGAASICQDHQGAIVLVRPTKTVEEILDLLGVYQIFPVAKGREEALSQLTVSDAAP